METSTFKSGFVALIGRPNVGKSTLLNACVGSKVAITSPVAQTTRKRIRGVITTDDAQMIIVDTPGIHKPKDALGKTLNKAALGELRDVDAAAFLLDATMPFGTGDEWVLHQLSFAKCPKILVVTKADKVDQTVITKQIEACDKALKFDDTIVVSSVKNFNVDAFKQVVSRYLPEGPKWFPDDVDSDMSDEELVSEFIREKILLNTQEEVPHSVGVICDSIVWRKGNKASITATIIVEREGQKGIIIGKKGAMIKKIGMTARHDLEKLFGAQQIYLELEVKVAPLWRRDQNEIRRLGYDLDQ